MIVEDDISIEGEMMERIKRKYRMNEKRPGIHQSGLSYCITKTWWTKKLKADREVTDSEALLWAVGLGLEKVLMEDEEDTHRPLVIEIDGILMSRDYESPDSREPAELKTTRSGGMTKDKPRDLTYGYSKGWIRQMLAYLKIGDERLSYRMAIFLVVPAKLLGKRFTFTKEAIEQNWTWLKWRRDVLVKALERDSPPEPFKYNMPWECERCSQNLACTGMIQLGRFLPKADEEPEPPLPIEAVEVATP